jgi:prepilin-type N-terminal cleavage/methylation domain-containing protein
MGASRQRGFTLVELISVLTIVAIMLTIALPAVTNMVKANAMNAASREVFNTLSLARQMAITHRVVARVVFPFSLTTPSNSLAPCYLSYAVMTDDVNYVGAWTYAAKWEHLPTGAVFVYDPTGSSVIGALDNTSCLLNQSLPFPYSSWAPAPLAYIEFGPTGAASQTGTLTIESGFIANNGLPQPTAPYNSVTNVVDNLVGRIQVIHP